MSNMFLEFYRSSNATSVTLPPFPSGFGSVAENMSGMFSYFSAGREGTTRNETVTLPEFETGFGSVAKDMSRMFKNTGMFTSSVTPLKSLPTGFGSVAENMSGMFAFDTPEDLRADNTSPCEFASPNLLLNISDFPAGFGSKTVDMSSMFMCFGAKGNPQLPNFPSETGNEFGRNATDMSRMFYGFAFFSPSTYDRITLPAFPSGFGGKTLNMDEMFYDIFSSSTQVQNLILPDGFGQEALSMQKMFAWSISRPSTIRNRFFPYHLPSGFGGKATKMQGMFFNCDFGTNVTWHRTVFHDPYHNYGQIFNKEDDGTGSMYINMDNNENMIEFLSHMEFFDTNIRFIYN
jgi:hypothetical protein